MQTVMERREIATGGTLETAQFSIKANGKAFKVLIDGLYSDKARAVVRELWTNAFDSHAEAGKSDVPFECQLPTIWEPSLRVRDYGVSLSHHGVMRLYTTVFESTKENTNSQVGKLGLGSKSPFAYTDTFTVTAWLDGEKRMYSAYIGSDYIPRISHMGTEPSDEPQGLEISFPVKAQDIEKFKTAAQRVRQGFDVHPTIVGADLPPIEDDMGKVLYSGTGWKIYDGLSSPLARQGCVIYPIDPHAVEGLSKQGRALLSAGLYIDFPIGDLEIAASREGLGYDAPTCANIIAQVERIERELQALFSAEIAAIKSRWELTLWVIKTRRSLPAAIADVITKGVLRGMNMSEQFVLDWHVLKAQAPKTFEGAFVQSYERGRGRRRQKVEVSSTHRFIITPDKTYIYVHFTDGPAVKAVRGRIHEEVIRLQERAYQGIFVTATKAQWKRIFVALGRPDVWKDVETLPMPIEKKNKPHAKVKVKEITRGGRIEVDIDPTEGGIYIAQEKMSYYKRFGDQVSVDLSEPKRIVGVLQELGFLTPTDRIFIVPKTLIRYVKDETKWLRLYDLAEEVVNTNWNQTKANRHATIDAAIDDHDFRRSWLGKIASDDDIQTKGAARYLQKYVRVLRTEFAQLDAFSKYRKLADLIERPRDVVSDLPLFKTIIKRFWAAYPMLRHVKVENGFLDDVRHYITLVDSQFALKTTVITNNVVQLQEAA